MINSVKKSSNDSDFVKSDNVTNSNSINKELPQCSISVLSV